MHKLMLSVIGMTLTALLLAACGGSPPAPAAAPAEAAPAEAAAPVEAAPTPEPATEAASVPAAEPVSEPTMDAGAMQHGDMHSDTSYDIHFIDSMVSHHAGVISMAEQVLRESQSTAAKDLAQNSMATAQRELDQLQAWRTQWHPDAPVMDDTMGMGPMGISSDAATPLEQRYVEAMVAHHQTSIAMAQEGLSQIGHEELKAMAEQMISGQEAEIAALRALLP